MVAIYAARAVPGSGGEMEEAVRAFLLDGDEVSGIGAVLCAAAVIDHVLAARVADADRHAHGLSRMAEKMPDVRSVLLQHPLRSRHFAQALEVWRSLRSNQLTAERLRDFEGNLLAQPPKI